ncbi:hypothetical protein BDW22DRAFT_1113028 [Trametopsis cervina]|nr:hypothetical protein BDW22DRAFT_1113028 [Trametopsis cervina]
MFTRLPPISNKGLIFRSLISVAVLPILFECVIIALTWIKTLNTERGLRRRTIGAHRSMSYLILRDGTAYFLMLLALDIFSLLSIRVEAFNNILAIIETLTSMLITRFILDLREDSMAAQTGSISSLLPSNIPELRLAVRWSSSLVGNLGAPVVNDCNALRV